MPTPLLMMPNRITALLAGLIFSAAAITDYFDGYLARRYGLVSNLGKVMDPVADSTFFMTVYFALSASPRFQLTIWVPILILYREVAIQVLRRRPPAVT